jgi:hypothetical protein
MTALTFTYDPAKDRHAAFQPDGTRVGHVRRSRIKDERYAFEARIRRPLTGITDSASFGPTPEIAKWLLVRSLDDHCERFTYLPKEY